MSESADKRRATLAGMRDLLWFLEQNPDVPMPKFEFTEWVWNKADLLAKGRALGTVAKEVGSGTFTLSKHFSKDVALKISTYQSNVCEKKVVGQKTVEYRPAQAAIEEHQEDVYEYDCKPLLADAAVEVGND